MSAAYILLMHNNQSEGDLCGKLLEDTNYVVVKAQSSDECLKLILESSFDLIVLDEEAAPLDGEELLTILRRLSDASILVIGSGDESRHINTLNQGADLYLKRPIQEAVFQANAKMLLWRRY